MPPRSMRPARENDFSDVGKVGRRTGVTLPQGRIDVNGMEEISGIFSSPRKPTPLRKSTSLTGSVERTSTGITPAQARSQRKSIPLPRSASPRKSGISGTARRSKAIDVLGQNKQQDSIVADQDALEDQPLLTPTLLVSGARKFSPQKTPLKNVVTSRPHTAKSTRRAQGVVDDSIQDNVEITQESVDVYDETAIPMPPATIDTVADDYIVPAVGEDEDQVSIASSQEGEFEEPPLPPPFDDEDADQTFEPESRPKPRPREPTIANSRRKRKSETLDQEMDVEVVSSPTAKRAKRISDQSTQTKHRGKSPKASPAQSAARKPRGRPPPKSKDTKPKMSKKQEDELNNIIERVKARPGQKKSLYVLRRETPADDGMTHTRSGRVSVKPLAYWRNEKCVFGGSPGGASLQDGARFPLNSIKEIIRTDVVDGKSSKRSKKSAKGKGKNKIAPRSQSAGSDEETSEEEQDEEYEVYEDPNAEPWETERGIFRGPVAVWDPQQQTPVDEEEEMDIAYASASIETREVQGSAFRYAKMLSMKFFGSGIVDLPSGGVKKAKNSRRWHMNFFVASGRVTVQVGPLGGPENRFSIGKGGWWHVPRGNQYSIENELEKSARVFFSQACEPIQHGEDE